MPPHIRSLDWQVRWVPIPSGQGDDVEGNLDHILSLESDEMGTKFADSEGYLPMLFLDPIKVIAITDANFSMPTGSNCPSSMLVIA